MDKDNCRSDKVGECDILPFSLYSPPFLYPILLYASSIPLPPFLLRFILLARIWQFAPFASLYAPFFPLPARSLDTFRDLFLSVLASLGPSFLLYAPLQQQHARARIDHVNAKGLFAPQNATIIAKRRLLKEVRASFDHRARQRQISCRNCI